MLFFFNIQLTHPLNTKKQSLADIHYVTYQMIVVSQPSVHEDHIRAAHWLVEVPDESVQSGLSALYLPHYQFFCTDPPSCLKRPSCVRCPLSFAGRS